ncbi:MAG TPA: thiamine pyrophosphate-dependent enzyme [Chloroflexota bacterium]|nr:thiamine pyrophosphate-dependent enzyme [Chloroflexota bacterium]
MIDRAEATRVAAELAGENPIISSVGNPTFDLFRVADRPRNFYIWNSMGMASSIGLGLALARPDRRVIVLDGDGSLLMNLGSLATTTMAAVTNLVHVVWDNGGWEITGAQPAGTTFGVDLEVIARGAGFRHTATVDTLDAFREAFAEAMSAGEARFIAARIENTSADHNSRPTKTLTALRDRFMEAVREPSP